MKSNEGANLRARQVHGRTVNPRRRLLSRLGFSRWTRMGRGRMVEFSICACAWPWVRPRWATHRAVRSCLRTGMGRGRMAVRPPSARAGIGAALASLRGARQRRRLPRGRNPPRGATKRPAHAPTQTCKTKPMYYRERYGRLVVPGGRGREPSGSARSRRCRSRPRSRHSLSRPAARPTASPPHQCTIMRLWPRRRAPTCGSSHSLSLAYLRKEESTL
jgi:hypothetical protein